MAFLPALRVVSSVFLTNSGAPACCRPGELVGLDSCLLHVFFCSSAFCLPVQFLPACCPRCDRVLTAVYVEQLQPWVLPGGPVGMSVVGPSVGRGSLQFSLGVSEILRIILFWKGKKRERELHT